MVDEDEAVVEEELVFLQIRALAEKEEMVVVDDKAVAREEEVVVK